MEQSEKLRHDALEPVSGSMLSDFIQASMLERIRPPADRSPRTSPDPEKILARAVDALLDLYLEACPDHNNVPLKEFMNGLEKKTLLACLQLTHGSQRNAAALLGLKPTALFEKMRKHYINGRKIKLLEKLGGAGHPGIA